MSRTKYGRIAKQLGKNPPRNSLHGLLMILRRKQMPVPVHGHLQAGMPSKALNSLRRQPALDPGRDREMPKRMPVEGRDIGPFEQRLEPPLDHIVMARIATAPVSEDKIRVLSKP